MHKPVCIVQVLPWSVIKVSHVMYTCGPRCHCSVTGRHKGVDAVTFELRTSSKLSMHEAGCIEMLLVSQWSLRPPVSPGRCIAGNPGGDSLLDSGRYTSLVLQYMYVDVQCTLRPYCETHSGTLLTKAPTTTGPKYLSRIRD